jgi:hypothetical protein
VIAGSVKAEREIRENLGGIIATQYFHAKDEHVGEIFLMNALVDAAESNVRDARRVRKALVDGARTIGEASGE